MQNHLMHNHRRISKVLIVVLLSCVWFIAAIGKARMTVGQFGLDQDSFMSLVATLQQGSISGRDFHFTYGPVAQVLAWLGTGQESAFEKYSLIILAWYAGCIVLFGAMVLSFGEIGPLYTVFLYFSVGALNLFWAPPALRGLLVLLAAIAAGKALTSAEKSLRFVWSAAGGLLCLVGQLTTIDLGVYAVSACTVLCLIYAFRARFVTDRTALHISFETLTTVWIVYIAGNLAVDGLFWFSSHYYSFFDYQRYALEIVRADVCCMGTPWELDRWRTAGFLIVTACTLLTALVTTNGRMDQGDRAKILGTTIGAIFFLKGAFIRSDVGHIVFAVTPTAVVFLMLGRWVIPLQKLQWKRVAVWICGILILYVSWPIKSTVFEDLKVGKATLGGGLTSGLRNTKTAENILPARVLSILGMDSSRPILNFPYDNHIGILLHRDLVAPVLQSYAADTLALQQYYVEGLDRFGDHLDVTYSVDEIAAWAVDGVQTTSRVPIIFDYLYRNFRLQEHTEGLLVLRRNREPRHPILRDLPFRTTDSREGYTEIHLDRSTNCGLMRLEMNVRHSYLASLSKPAPIAVSAWKKSEAIMRNNFVPIASNRPFHTFLSTVRPEAFFRLFGEENIPSREWDGIAFGMGPRDWLTASPRLLEVNRLECVDGERFQLAD